MSGWLLAAWLTACGGDGITTHAALKNGAREVLMTQNPWTNDGVIAGQAVVVPVLLNNLHKTHPKLAIGMAIAATAWRGWAVRNNLGVLQQLRRQN